MRGQQVRNYGDRAYLSGYLSAQEPSWVGRLESAGKEECTRKKAISVTFPIEIELSCHLLPSQNSNFGFDSLLLSSLSHTTSTVRTPGFVHKSWKGLRKYPDQSSHCSSEKTRPRPTGLHSSSATGPGSFHGWGQGAGPPPKPQCGEYSVYDSVSTGDVQISDKITISKNFKENVIRPILKVRGFCPSH